MSQEKKKPVSPPSVGRQHPTEDVEEFEEIRAYDKAKVKREGSVAFEDAVRRIQSRAKK